MFDPVECVSAGTYNISINDGEAYDLANLEVKVNPETPTFTIPSDMFENQRTTATCTAQLGDPPGSLYLELMPVGGQYARLAESFSVNISKGNCSNIGRLDAVFYPNSTWSGSKLSCVAEGPDKLQTFRSDEKVTVIKSPSVAFNMKYYAAVVGAPLQLICVVTGWNGNLSINRVSKSNQQQVKVVNLVNNETGSILNGFAVNRTFSGYNVNVFIFIANVSCEDEGSYYCTSGAVSDNATVKRLPEKPTIQLPDIMIRGTYHDINNPFVCEGEVENPGGILISEVNMNGTFYLYKAFKETRRTITSECGSKQLYTFFVDGTFTQDWDNAKIRCVAINNMTGSESAIRQTSEEKTIRLLSADICKNVTTGSNISHPHSNCDLYLTCQAANTLLLGKCPQGLCFFDNVRACRSFECPCVCFSPDEYRHNLNGTAQLNCTVTGLTSGDIVTFSRVKSGNDTLKSFATVEFSKEPTYNISGIHIRAVPLSGNESIFILTIISVSCGDRGTYFCKVGNRQASARLIIWQKPGTPTLIMSRLIVEKTYMQPEYPLVCQGEVGYPSGKMMVEVNKNGSYAKYNYFEIASVPLVSDDECSTYETLKFAIPGLVSMNLNNTLMRCVATNDITLTPNESPPTSLLQRIYVVPDSFCSSLNNGHYRHPYECTMYISCMNRLITPQTCGNQCPNATGIGSITCVNCSTVRCKDQEGFIEPTTAATTTTIAACAYVRCDSVQARLNSSAIIHCQILFCGGTFNLSVMSVGINIQNRVNNTFSATKHNVRVLVNADKGAATLNITFDPVECDSAGTYNISIDNFEAYDLPNLEVKVNPETPTFIIPSDMFENQRTTAICTAQLGDPPGSLYLELMPVGGQYARLGESFSVNISKGNCSNIGRLDAVFYPNSTWNGSKLSCVAEGPDRLQTFRSEEKVTVIKSPKIYFTKTSYLEFVGSSTRLTCVAKELSSADLQTVKIERHISSGGTEFVASVFINGTLTNAFENVSISNESSINSSSATIHIDFHYLSCADKGNYYCIAGGFSAKGNVDILRKPGIPTFNMSKYIYENKYMQIQYPMVCEGEIGYPSGKMVVETYTNGSFIEYQYYNVSRQVRVSVDTCSTHETLVFALPGLVPLALNNTVMRCVATNDITLTSLESPSASQTKRLYVVPASFCNGLKTGDYIHPYECTFYITCAAGVVSPGYCFGRCANITSVGAQCLDCSQVICVNPGLTEDTTTAITTTTKATCPNIRCADAYASLNDSGSIECSIKFCGPTFDFSITSDNLKLQNSTSGNFSRTEGNVHVNVYVNSGDAILSIVFNPIKCKNAGTYNVSINSGASYDLATLHVKVIHESPTLTIPSNIYVNQRTAMYCTAQLGDPPGSLHIEISSPGKPVLRFESLINITRGNCSNIGRVDVDDFYPNATLNESNIVCVANGPNNQGLSLSEEKTMLIKSSKIYFTNTSNSGFIGSSTRLTCLIKEMTSTDLQTVRITRDYTPGATEYVASFSMNRTINGAFQNISISNESSITSSEATIHVDFYHLTCTDERNYYCNAGTMFAKGALQILRKPNILDFRFPAGILENANSGTFNCTAEKGYPAGRLVIGINTNGTFVEAPFMLNRNNAATSEGCSNIETVTFSHIFISTWNRTAIQCKAENELTLGKNEEPPSVAKNVLIVPADICRTSNTSYIPHPYYCKQFITCGITTYAQYCPAGLCRFTAPHNETYCDWTCKNCTDFGI